MSVIDAPKSVLMGSAVPRLFTPPLRELTRETSRGFDLIDFARDVVGLELRPWQEWLAIHALELLPDGSPRFRTILLLVARQNGKSLFLQILSLFSMYVLRSRLVLGTAQNLDIAEDQWEGAIELAEGSEELAAEIRQVMRGSGKLRLVLMSGERYRVAAASRRGGRGLSGDLIILDELREHQAWDSWGAVSKTTMARPNAIVFGASNAGDETSVVLQHLRLMCHVELGDPDGAVAAAENHGWSGPPDDLEEGELDTASIGLFEWSADPDFGVWDREGWAQANPLLGYEITERAIVSAARTDPEWVFRNEVLCQWPRTGDVGVFPTGKWDQALSPSSEIVGEYVFGVDVAVDRTHAAVVAAGLNRSGQTHIEIVAYRAGLSWLIGWLADRIDDPELKGITAQGVGAPISSMIDEIEALDVPFFPLSGSNLIKSHGQFYDLVASGGLARLAQPVLDTAVGSAKKKLLGEAWVFNRRSSPVDISPLEAAVAAVWASKQEYKKTVAVSAYEDSGLTVV